ncbi:M48 family metallopeptidase [Streptomyces polygonati]|uniref:M48 family metallopeptidase n=1 Tax=Streptomyces polygonati TaxID=1617087 RepID=A0ABV8HDF8_9ACTN
MTAATVYMFVNGSDLAGLKLTLFTAIVVFSVAFSFVRTLVGAKKPPPGVPLARADAPELWEIIARSAEAMRTRPPDEVLLIAEANAYVAEASPLLGLFPGRRYLCLGTPLLTALTVDQFTFVLSHELGHYSHKDTRLAAITFVSGEAIVRAVQYVGFGTPWRAVLRGYLWIFELVSLAVRRRQEYLADSSWAGITDRDSAVTALLRLDSADRAWSAYLETCAGTRVGDYVLGDAVLGFRHFLATWDAGVLEYEEAGAPPDRDRSKWATHPPTDERIAAIEAMEAAAPAGPADHRPADALLPALPSYGPRLDRLIFPDPDRRGGRRAEPFPPYAVRLARGRRQDEADVLYGAAARVAGTPGAGLGEVLDLLARGYAPDIVAQLRRVRLDVDHPNPTVELARRLEAALERAAEASGAARRSYSEDTGVVLVATDGRRLDLGPLARRAIGGGAEVAGVRARLADLGVTENLGHLSDSGQVAEPARTVGALAVRLNGSEYDLIVRTTSLVFVPVERFSTRWENPYERLLDRAQNFEADEVRSPGGFLLVPFERIQRASVFHETRANVRLLLLDGTSLSLVDTGPERAGKRPGRYEHSAEAREALRGLAASMPPVTSAPVPVPSSPTLRRLAAMEEDKRGNGKVNYVRLVGASIVLLPVGMLLTGLRTGDVEVGYAFAVVFAIPAVVLAVYYRRGVRQRKGGGGRGAARRAQQLASAGTGLAPVRWGVIGLALAVCCPPLGVLSVLFGIRSVREARMTGRSVALGAAAIAAAPVVWLVLVLIAVTRAR